MMRNQPLRPVLRRNSPLSAMHIAHEGPLPQAWKLSLADSSDDEVPVAPMKFSAEAKAILGDEASVIDTFSPPQKNMGCQDDKGVVNDASAAKRSSPPLRTVRNVSSDRTGSPTAMRPANPRIIRLNVKTSPVGSIPSYTEEKKKRPEQQIHNDLITPAPRLRNSILSSNSSGSERRKSTSYDTKPASSASTPIEPQTAVKDGSKDGEDAAAQVGSVSVSRKPEDSGVHSSIRVKRLGGVGGRYLSGPARRGMRRRQSEEDQSPVPEDLLSPDEAPQQPKDDAQEGVHAASVPPEARKEPPQESPEEERRHVRFQSRENIAIESPTRNDNRLPRPLEPASSFKQNQAPNWDKKGSSGTKAQPMFKVPALPLLPSRFDQENEPPPTFKRNKVNSGPLLERLQKLNVISDEKMLVETPATESPKRQALGPRSQNTPHRPAPPPPKMTVLETATVSAGAASASQSRKRRNYISVNNKLFTRMDCIGRGGSSKVYRVMAENFKVFALKRVTLEDQDEAAIRGFKGEIDLLKKLENVDRVVRLFDWELSETKHTLSVLMEMGESDLNRVLTLKLSAEDARFDITFTRYYWKEMLECVQAVHQYEIVHSDLKPANFLLLQGRLKLIDFGISNAIQDDTINVHREQHIGTPNYMSPEAFIDSNANSGLPSTVGKIMKLGKPSDVWSLGCILYQMVYGKPPFAHIANQMQRIMAIPNPRHVIEFPEQAVGGVPVPTGLVRILKRCLNRDQRQRPTISEMLAPGDAFLDPDMAILGTVPVGQDLIARLQHSMLKHIREKGMPSETELAGWPGRYFASIRAAVEEGKG
ncbi:MAG: hypothetical protein LQ351_004353 [Letrouitia transgressa]|nr:MAG: hypothetical protein LQ351_004353 [Letrouitia transgressa]